MNTAAERVQAYLDAYSTMSMYNQEALHTIHVNGEPTVLRRSDLETLVKDGLKADANDRRLAPGAEDRAAMSINPNPPGVTLRKFTKEESDALDLPPGDVTGHWLAEKMGGQS